MQYYTNTESGVGRQPLAPWSVRRKDIDIVVNALQHYAATSHMGRLNGLDIERIIADAEAAKRQ